MNEIIAIAAVFILVALFIYLAWDIGHHH